MKTTINHTAPRVWSWEVRAADGRGFAGVTTTRANVRALVRSSTRALAALVVATVAACGARPVRRTLPSGAAVNVAPSFARVTIDPCGTYPDMPECHDSFTPGQ